jgi:hypothetical protein
MPTPKKTPARSGQATGQPAKDYPDLSAGEGANEAPDGAQATAAGADDDQAGKPVLDLKRPYNMIWHDGLKQYYQDGKIFDRGSKQYLCDA